MVFLCGFVLCAILSHFMLFLGQNTFFCYLCCFVAEGTKGVLYQGLISFDDILIEDYIFRKNRKDCWGNL